MDYVEVPGAGAGSQGAIVSEPRPGRGRPAVSDRMDVSSPGRKWNRFIVSAVLILVGLSFVLPLSWLILASVDTRPSAKTSVPSGLTLSNFADVFTVDIGLRPLAVSFLLSLIAATVTIVVALLAAYPLSRYKMRFNQPFMYVILFGTCLPITAIMVPVFSLAVRANVLDNLFVVALFMGATSLPMAIWMSKNFMDSVPMVLEEAAWIDGASGMRTLSTIVVPLMRPGIAVVFMYTFMQAWGNFFVPFLLLRSPANKPAAVQIYQFFGQYGAIDYGELAAFSILYSVPAIVLYVIVQRGMGGSFAMSGAVKG